MQGVSLELFEFVPLTEMRLNPHWAQTLKEVLIKPRQHDQKALAIIDLVRSESRDRIRKVIAADVKPKLDAMGVEFILQSVSLPSSSSTAADSLVASFKTRLTPARGCLSPSPQQLSLHSFEPAQRRAAQIDMLQIVRVRHLIYSHTPAARTDQALNVPAFASRQSHPTSAPRCSISRTCVCFLMREL